MKDWQTESKKEGTDNYMELKDRIVIISERNMDNMNSLYGKCATDELERIVNNMIDNAVVEINEDRSRLHMDRVLNCRECEYMKEYNYGQKVYYCDHKDRTDEMGKLGVSDIPRECPVWCPLKYKIDDSFAAK